VPARRGPDPACRSSVLDTARCAVAAVLGACRGTASGPRPRLPGRAGSMRIRAAPSVRHRRGDGPPYRPV